MTYSLWSISIRGIGFSINDREGTKKMKKYSLKWWYETGAIYRAHGSRDKRIAKGYVAHLAFMMGYKFGKWKLAPEGDFARIVFAKIVN